MTASALHQCCESGIFTPDTDFCPSRIPDLKKVPVTTEKGEKKLVASFYKTFYKKIVIKRSKIWVWDPGSEIRDSGFGKTYSGSRIQGVKNAPAAEDYIWS
jgi:hypothetical protein